MVALFGGSPDPPRGEIVPTEWLKVMLDEIARKRDDAARAREELERRRAAREPLPPESDAPAVTARRPA